MFSWYIAYFTDLRAFTVVKGCLQEILSSWFVFSGSKFSQTYGYKSLHYITISKYRKGKSYVGLEDLKFIYLFIYFSKYLSWWIEITIHGGAKRSLTHLVSNYFWILSLGLSPDCVLGGVYLSTSLWVVPNFSQGIWSEQNTQVRADENCHLRMSPSLRATFFTLVCTLCSPNYPRSQWTQTYLDFRSWLLCVHKLQVHKLQV